MDQNLKYELEHSAVEGITFSEDPGWFFVLLENGEMVRELLALIGQEGEAAEEAVFVFARADQYTSSLDACGALFRMKETAVKNGKDLVFHPSLTGFLKSPASQRLRMAVGVKEGYACIAACLVSDTAQKERELRWDVFSSVQ